MTTLFDLPFEEPEPVPDDEPAGRRVFTVSELTAEVRTMLEARFFEVWVEGELSNCRLWNTGHLYFTVKDQAAQLKGVMFRSSVRYLRFRPEDGLHVIARGRISLYEPKGEYQLVCEHLEPRGFGALQLAYEQLKRRLHGEGLFDPGRKRPLPALPRKIGIVTSADGAALRDILKVLQRRHGGWHVIIRPARVQGDGAAAEIARGLEAIGRVEGVDVIIVGRGGGSVEDLWAFNEEVVARAIAAAPVPVISAVGHEIDVTISDLVADLRAPTPSAAAEMVMARKSQQLDRIAHLRRRADSAVQSRMYHLRVRVHGLVTRPALAGIPGRVALRGRHVAELTHNLRRVTREMVSRRDRRYRDLRLRLESLDFRRRLPAARSRLVQAKGRLGAALSIQMQRREAGLRALTGQLNSLSPLGVLSRGYAVCWNADRTAIIRDAASVAFGDEVHVRVRTGSLTCEVTGSTQPESTGDLKP